MHLRRIDMSKPSGLEKYNFRTGQPPAEAGLGLELCWNWCQAPSKASHFVGYLVSFPDRFRPHGRTRDFESTNMSCGAYDTHSVAFSRVISTTHDTVGRPGLRAAELTAPHGPWSLRRHGSRSLARTTMTNAPFSCSRWLRARGRRKLFWLGTRRSIPARSKRSNGT